MSEYFDLLFSKYQCDFRKGHNTQHSEKWKRKNAIDDIKSFPTLLTDLFIKSFMLSLTFSHCFLYGYTKATCIQYESI